MYRFNNTSSGKTLRQALKRFYVKLMWHELVRRYTQTELWENICNTNPTEYIAREGCLTAPTFFLNSFKTRIIPE
jgi:hypothetical protein